jgi:putative hydroxymethylpyrimidine transport system substrate-binding protein
VGAPLGENPLNETRRPVIKLRRKSLGAISAALVVCAATVAAGCGEKSESTTPGTPQPFSLALDFYVNPDHAGIFEAIDNGYFSDAGLDVETHTPSDPSSPIKDVAAGRVDLAISYEPEVLLAQAQDPGLPVKAVAALVPTPLTSLIWLKDSGIQDVKGLQGKTIATAGIPYQEAYLKTILEREGLSTSDVNTVDVQQNLLPAVISNKAQAILGGFLNVEGVDLKLQGKDPTVIPVDKLGIPTYNELVLVANADSLDSKEEDIRLFLDALERGTKAAVADPAGATKAVLDAGNGLDPKITRAEVDKTLPLLMPKGGKHPYGYMDPAQWKKFAQFFADNGVINALPSTDDLLTNDLLPTNEVP